MKETDIILAGDEFARGFGPSRRSYLLQPTAISAYLAYQSLKQLFGAPNSQDIDPDKTQWEYRLRILDSLAEVYDWKMNTWSIAIYTPEGSEGRGKELAEGLYKLIEKAANHHRSKEKAARASPKGFVIQNPFSVYYSAADSVLDKAKTLNNQIRPPGKRGLTDIMDDFFLRRDLCKGAFLLYLAAFEGLLNLIYELYLSSRLRDERISERLQRDQLDIKLRLAPVYCGCFKGDLIDILSDEFKTFQRIVNLRNDFVHANFTKHMKTPVVEDDGHTFLIDMGDLETLGLPANFSTIETDHVLTVKQNIDDMVDILASAMKPRYRKEFLGIIHQEYVVVVSQNGELVPQVDSW